MEMRIVWEGLETGKGMEKREPKPRLGGGDQFATLVRSNLQAGVSRGTDCADTLTSGKGIFISTLW